MFRKKDKIILFHLLLSSLVLNGDEKGLKRRHSTVSHEKSFSRTGKNKIDKRVNLIRIKGKRCGWFFFFSLSSASRFNFISLLAIFLLARGKIRFTFHVKDLIAVLRIWNENVKSESRHFGIKNASSNQHTMNVHFSSIYQHIKNRWKIFLMHVVGVGCGTLNISH